MERKIAANGRDFHIIRNQKVSAILFRCADISQTLRETWECKAWKVKILHVFLLLRIRWLKYSIYSLFGYKLHSSAKLSTLLGLNLPGTAHSSAVRPCMLCKAAGYGSRLRPIRCRRTVAINSPINSLWALIEQWTDLSFLFHTVSRFPEIMCSEICGSYHPRNSNYDSPNGLTCIIIGSLIAPNRR